MSVEYLATGKDLSEGVATGEQNEEFREKMSSTLIDTAKAMFSLLVLLNIIGYLTGAFRDMLSIPIGSSGDRLGILLVYGDSVFAIILIVLEVISMVFAIVLVIVSKVIERKQK